VDNLIAKDLPCLMKWMMFDDSGRKECLRSSLCHVVEASGGREVYESESLMSDRGC
jgi:hypothetical protein